ncbi:GAF domain-containing protein [Aggregatilinea lenta]|uniref:GAF domain-containing protein n=1 Tax=Aggregatilinea lenta TaxID=913108 RepID=UPI0013C2BACF|nr:GAF domain-containing protein [Aggregatilinea lenta]
MRTPRLTGQLRSRINAFNRGLAPGARFDGDRSRYILWLQTILIYALIPFGFVLSVVAAYHHGETGTLWRSPELIGVVLVAVAAGGARWLNARGYVQASSLILIVTAAGVVFGLAVHRMNIGLLHYLLLVTGIGALLLPRRALAALTVSIVAVTLLLPLVVPEWSLADLIMHGLGFVLFGLATMSLVLRYYQAIEHERRSQLIDSEAKYRQLVERSPMGMLVYVDDKIVYANHPALKILGATRLQDVLNLRAEDFIYPTSDVFDLRAISLDQDAPVKPIREQIVRLDGALCELEVVPFRSTFEGRPSVQVLFHDITYQRTTESALYRSEVRMRALLSAIPDLMFRFNRQGVFVDYKPSSDMQLFAPAERFMGQHVREILPPHLANRICRVIERTLETGDIQIFTYQLPRDDSAGEFEARFVPSGTDEVTAIVRDVTQARRAEEALRRRDAILEALAGASEQLLQSGSLDAALSEVLARLGRAVPDSRVALFENEREPGGQRVVSRRCEWRAGEVQLPPSGQNNPLEAEACAAWEETLSQGQVLYGLVRDRSPQERALLEADGVASFAVVPIFTDGDWWGFLRIDNYAAHHEWMPVEVEALRNLAGILGAAIVRQRGEIAEREQRQVIEALRDTAEIIGSSLQLGEVLTHILTSLNKVVEHDAAHIILLDGDKAHLVRSAGYSSEVTDDILISLGALTACTHQVIHEHRPLLVPDVRESFDRLDMPALDWVRSHLCIPIELGGDVIGMLSVDDARINCYTATHVERLQTFAAQTATAIRNAQLYDRVQQHAKELETLRGMMLNIGTTLDLDTLLCALVEDMVRILNADRGGIYLYQPETETLVWRVGFGFDEVRPGFSVVRGQGLAGGVLETNDVEIVNDFTQWQGRRLASWNYDNQSAIAVPITRQGQTLGVFLAAADQSRRTFGEHDARLMRLFANQTAVAIQTAQLFQAEREQRQLAEALRDLATALGGTVEIDGVFDQLADTVGQLINYDALSVMLIEGAAGRFVFHRGLDFPDTGADDRLRKMRFTPDMLSPLRTVVEQGAPYVIGATSELGWAEDWPLVSPDAIPASYLAVPMQIEGKTVGIVSLLSRHSDMFTSTHAEWLRAFANQTAIAMENTRLYAELSRHAEEMAVLHRGTSFLFTSLSSSAELKDVGAQISQAVTDEFGGVDCAVFLVDREQDRCIRLDRAGNNRLRTTGPIELAQISPVTEAVHTESLIYLPDIVPTDLSPGQAAPRARSELVIPLTTAKGLIGVLDLQSAEPHAFSVQDRSILSAFAERVAVVLENRQLYDEIRQYTDELEQRVDVRTVDLSVRNAVAQTLSSSLDMGEMLDGVLKTAVEELSVMGGAIYLLNADSETLKLAAHYGISETDLALVTGIVPGTPDVSLPGAAPQEDLDIARETGVSAVVSVPIWRKDHIQGIITLVNDQPRPWRTEETHMLDAIGRQIGVALANAALYTEAVRGEAHLRTILRSVADGLLVFDPKGNLILMNPAADDLFTFYPEEAGGPQEAARLLMAWFQSTRPTTPGPVNVEFALPVDPLVDEGGVLAQCLLERCEGAERKNPAWPCWLQTDWRQDPTGGCPVIARMMRRSVQAHSADIRDGGGADLGTVIVLHDVTYFRELDELKGRFVSTVSHELRTPLSAILLQVSTLLKYYARFEDDERQEMLADVEQQAHILRELIEDILELSRFDSKRATLQKRWINLSDLYHSVLATMRPVSDEKSLSFRLAGLDDDCFVEGDAHQLERVFRNLLSNAIKYTSEGGQIAVEMEQGQGEVRLSITDSGIGIAPEEQNYVFDRFFRARTATRIASGTGLGLSIVKEIVDLHEGCIELTSELGVGSTFTVTIPVGRDEMGEAAVPCEGVRVDGTRLSEKTCR